MEFIASGLPPAIFIDLIIFNKSIFIEITRFFQRNSFSEGDYIL